MDSLTEKINRTIDTKMDSMTNLAIPAHNHNGWDANQLDPAIALLGFPVIQATLGVITTNTLFGGTTGYTTKNNVVTTGGTGKGLTVNITAVAGQVTVVVINQEGTGYTVGDVITITGGDGTATFHVLTVRNATVAPKDTPFNGIFRFYVDTTPTYRLWAYLVYNTTSNVATGAWKSIALI